MTDMACMTGEKSILVLGVGNILYADEGLGVYALQQLEHDMIFSPNVYLLDGGTQGYLLMDAMMSCDVLIVLDAVQIVKKQGKSERKTAPAAIHILQDEDLRQSMAFSDSLHQTDLVDTLVLCDMAGHRPDTIVIGMEPVDYTSQSLSLTPIVVAQMPAFCRVVLETIERFGGQYRNKTLLS